MIRYGLIFSLVLFFFSFCISFTLLTLQVTLTDTLHSSLFSSLSLNDCSTNRLMRLDINFTNKKHIMFQSRCYFHFDLRLHQHQHHIVRRKYAHIKLLQFKIVQCLLEEARNISIIFKPHAAPAAQYLNFHTNLKSVFVWE